jgi:hypothetical protein
MGPVECDLHRLGVLQDWVLLPARLAAAASVNAFGIHAVIQADSLGGKQGQWLSWQHAEYRSYCTCRPMSSSWPGARRPHDPEAELARVVAMQTNPKCRLPWQAY